MSTKRIKRANRFDFANLSSGVSVTPQGFVRIHASLTRVGVLQYTRADSTVIRELRHPDEVFRADSLQSLRGAPVTEGHQSMITPDNIASFGVGFAGEQITHNDKTVDGDLIVQRKDSIAKVKSKALCEISAGYTCTIDPTPGTWQGERYDQAQQNIIYNHIALGPRGWGRAGPGVRLHLDSADDVAYSRLDAADPPPSSSKKTIEPKGIEMKKIIIRLDGIDYEIEVSETLATTFKTSLDKLQTERNDARETCSTTEGKLAAAEKSVVELKTKLDSVTSPECIDAAVAERVQLLSDAQKLYPEIKLDGKEPREIKLDALEKAGYERATFDERDEHFLDGVFYAAIGNVKTPKNPAVVGIGPVLKREDGGDPKVDRLDADASRNAMIKRNTESWQQPIGKTKNA